MNIRQLITDFNNNLKPKSFEVENVSVNRPIAIKNNWQHAYTEGTYKQDNNNYKISLKISKQAIAKAKKKKIDLEPATYNLKATGYSVSNFGQLTLEVAEISKSGYSAREIRNQQLMEFAKRNGLLKRRKKKIPKKVSSVLCLTSRSSDIKQDIVANIGLKAKDVFVFNCYDSKVIADNIKRSRDVDIIVLYRGGHEDDNMDIFSNEEVLLAIANSKIPVCAALGHEQDKPFVYNVADKTYSTPSAFAKEIYKHNNDKTKNNLLKILLILWTITVIYFYNT